MSLVLTDRGADFMLRVVFNNVWPAGGRDLTLRLYVNDKTPVDTDVTSDYVEASGGGYAPKTLINGSWTINTANDPSDAVYPQQTFTFSGPLTGNAKIYGYFVTNADGVLIWAERFSVFFQPANNGDSVNITPRFQKSKGIPS